MGASPFFVVLLTLASFSSGQEESEWLWQFADYREERELESDESIQALDDPIKRGAREITQLIQGEGEGDGAFDEGNQDSPSSKKTLIYEALRLLNPNTLNMTIYWHCISADYQYLSNYGAFQKDDEKYRQCEAEGHLLFERSCLHNMLVPSNCFDGTWSCNSDWVGNVDMAVKFIHDAAKRWPQCFTQYSTMESKTLTWDCEERCDLPCSYPEKFCPIILESYNSSECKLECPHGNFRRLRQGNVHDMTLTIGNFHALPTPPPPTSDADESNEATPSPPTPTPSTSATPTPATLPPSPSTPAPATPEPVPPTSAAPTPATPAPATPTLPPTSASPTVAPHPDDDITLVFSFVLQSSRAINELESDQHFMSEMKMVGLKALGLPGGKIGWINVALSQAAARRLDLHLRRRLTASISVDYSAHIPKAAVDEVVVVSDPVAVEREVEDAIQRAENASGVSYGVVVDSSSIAALTNELESRWAAAVAPEVASTSTTSENQLLDVGLQSAAESRNAATRTFFAVQFAMIWFAFTVG